MLAEPSLDLPYSPDDRGSPLRRAVPAGGGAIALDGVSLSFGGLDVLRDVGFGVAPGEIVGLIGPNGAGKSSLLNVLSGFYAAGRGTVAIDGDRVVRPRPQIVARAGVVRTFQNLGLFPGMTVLDNVLVGRALHIRAGWPRYLLRLPSARRDAQRNRTQALAALAALELANRADTLVASLPYGAQKRVELARALAMEPRILLLDEPLAGMNDREKQEMVAAVRSVNAERGTTVVMIEHDVRIMTTLADRLIVLDRGRIIADGPAAAVAADERVIAAYLGTRH